MKKIILLVLLLSISHFSFGQEDAFKNDAVKYLTLSGQKQTFQMLTKDIINNIPEEKKLSFQLELDKAIDDLMGKMAEKYKEEFTHKEIKELIKFYESKAGKKLAEKTTILYEKGQKVGEEWGAGLQQIIMNYMKTTE